MNFRIDYKKKDKVPNKKLEQYPQFIKTPTLLGNNCHVVITGVIPGMSRTKASQLLAIKGLIIQPVINKSTQYLILGNTRNTRTSKYDYAIRNNIKIIEVNYVKELSGVN